MRILVHDFAGHPPQVYLSRALARRGHDVLHLYADDLETPRGRLEIVPSDPPTFAVKPVGFNSPYRKHNYFVRQVQEWGYGGNLLQEMRRFAPDIVICSNTPLVPLWRLQTGCRRDRVPFLFWLMDVYSVAVSSVLRRKMPGLGRLISAFYGWLEGYELRRSDYVVLISEGFEDIVRRWGVPASRMATLPLWSALSDINVGEKANAWSKGQRLAETTNLIYSGTLGYKHNPELLVALAERMADRSNVRVVVISEGPGADYIRDEKAARGLRNLVLLPFQRYEDLPLVLASSDVMLALLEPDAGTFSVPGKVLTHLCAGRPQVAAVPAENRANRIIRESGGGLTCTPGDEAGFVAAVQALVDDPKRRGDMGRRARQYAEREFDIDRLAGAFETCIGAAKPLSQPAGRSPRAAGMTEREA
jgi:glycosyltransferase involved in cell wall biosynthesis